MKLRNELSIEYNDIQKMVFIYNALNDGWTVKKINKDKYELKKDNENIKKEIILDECIKKYVKYNISNR
jgi:hypothetical protein